MMHSYTAFSVVLDRAWIAERIPHAGKMCLLDRVVAWSDESIHCVATSHLDPNNPLRANGRLTTLCGIEYAAQAMAVHGSLIGTARRRPRVGLLASVRNVAAYVERLDTLEGPLSVEAERMSGVADNVLYRFALHCSDRPVLSGRAAVILDASNLDSTWGPGKTDTGR
jgi:predicted hotdog family 3-hydroxylacyl-ACP dehydratase